MIGTGQDITERRRVEEQRDQLLLEERRAGEFREAFIDVISHELRTPITTILGLTQILARPGRADDPASRAALLEDVRAESERLHRLVEDLLVLSRAERGRLVIDAEPLQPRRLHRTDRRPGSSRLPSLHIETRLGPDLPVVAGEGTYVEQIVRNLLGNAAKYTPAGTKVVIDARRDDSVVEIRVTDDGPGIPDESLRRVFDLFYRDPDSARAVAGSGIGLFVCRSLVEAMGGRMWALRPPGGGSEFGFTLRVLEADELDAEEPDERHPVSLLEPRRREISPEPAPANDADGGQPAAIGQPGTRYSAGERVDLVRVDAELADRLGRLGRGHRAASRQRDEGRRRDVGRVDLEQRPQVLAGAASAEPVRAERHVGRRQPARHHVGQRLHPVGGSHDRAAVAGKHGRDVGNARVLGVGVQPVPALGLERLAPQERERRGAVDLGGDAEPLGQQVARRDDPVEDRARADEPGRVRVLPDLRGLGEPVDPAQDPLVDARRPSAAGRSSRCRG